ncbi:hypothetical protein GGH12_005400 [Coemansia sp. RSA 1822]|nr:hypothetical protein LPJ76_005370 [Coemansia sp. RSA 638]KAJ2122587.1 hypothetical protein IW147_003249 [Coemansia sp. RSA 720]KAJ2539364.1 hypothetical protein GGF49_005273 [Coemansia sp. RSA 1853]KAJ2559438.1 hypothetical protein GGH12_005400 [Coemansia sp. RSA 1822]
MSSNEQQPLLGSTRSNPDTGVSAWWASRSRDVLSLLTVLLLLGTGLGIWVYGTLPTSDPSAHPHEYALSTDNIRRHLTKLLEIAREHNNSRSVTTGHAASGSYVLSQLEKYGNCDSYKQRFVSPVWTVTQPPTLRVREPYRVDYIHETDFELMRYGGRSANITHARITVAARACAAKDIGDVSGRVVVVESTKGCSLFEAAFMLEQMGARAVVFVRAAQYKQPSRMRVRFVEWKEGDALMTIPVLSVTHSVGQVLAHASQVDIETHSQIDEVETFNILCVGRTGDPRNTIVVGAHLDSVRDGPGINDNGSGSSSILEIQLTLARIRFAPHNRLVFAWWGAEEDGLLGSRHFTHTMARNWTNKWTPHEPRIEWTDIALNLNFDMLASPNYIALVHNGTHAPHTTRTGSQRIQRVFENYFARHQYAYEVTDMRGGSDFLPFVQNGVPAGGVLTGAGEVKSIKERLVHGGLAHAALDTCYHRDCDTLLNINIEALQKMSRAAMYAVSTLASTVDLRGYLAGQPEF